MASTRVVHMYHDHYDIRIDRRTKWGNPFKEGRDGTRDEVIAKYEAWIKTQPALMAALPELRGKVLGCWCAPNLVTVMSWRDWREGKRNPRAPDS